MASAARTQVYLPAMSQPAVVCLYQAVIVRTRKEYGRNDGSHIRFDDNAAVVLENVANKTIIGTRIFGPIARELRERGFDRIVSLAKEVY